MSSFILCTPHQMLSGLSNQAGDRRGMWHAWGRSANGVLMANSNGKSPLGRPRRRWEGNIRMGLKKYGWEAEDWIDLAQNGDRWRAVVKTVMNLRVP
jgi:hypothetical protein